MDAEALIDSMFELKPKSQMSSLIKSILDVEEDPDELIGDLLEQNENLSEVYQEFAG